MMTCFWGRLVNAYWDYRDKWVFDHISQHIQAETSNKYRSSEESDYWTFKEYIDKYSYTNGMTPVCFDEWYDEIYKGDLTFDYDIREV